VYAASAATGARSSPPVDYSDRSGFPRPPADMRGAALANFQMPRDLRTPDALASYTRQGSERPNGAAAFPSP
jgi:hypothetical protein